VRGAQGNLLRRRKSGLHERRAGKARAIARARCAS
jgi:hypothetical protein